jgi:hypothetical protein
MAGVFPRREATASTARSTLRFAWRALPNGARSASAQAASTVPAQVRKSLAVNSSPAISFR